VTLCIIVLDSDTDPLIRCALDTDPDPSIIKQKNNKKNLGSYCFGSLFDLLSLKNYVNVNVPSKSNKAEKVLKN
jgi:hypothetical protein